MKKMMTKRTLTNTILLLITALFVCSCSSNASSNEESFSSVESINSEISSNIESSEESSVHQHYADGDYFHSSSSHWKVCDECGDPFDEEPHNFVNGICTICHYERDDFQIKLTKPFNGNLVNPYHVVVSSYLTATTEEKQIAALDKGGVHDEPNFKISWNQLIGATKYKILISEDENLDNVIYTLSTNLCNFNLSVLIPGHTYYYRIVGLNNDGQIVGQSKIDYLIVEPVSTVRQIYIEGMYNVRDLGGWKVNDDSIAYNKLFRGGRIDAISPSGKETLINQLGIKTEIDLRYDGTDCLLDENVSYQKHAIWGYTEIIPDFTYCEPGGYCERKYDPDTTPNLANIFRILANKNNYPMYFHCNAGADRTGTLAFLISAICGVSKEDIYRDFELTTFSTYGDRWRSSVTNNSFDSNGVFQNDSNNYVAFDKMINVLTERYSTDENTLSSTVINFLKQTSGVTDVQINNIKAILLNHMDQYNDSVETN